MAPLSRREGGDLRRKTIGRDCSSSCQELPRVLASEKERSGCGTDVDGCAASR